MRHVLSIVLTVAVSCMVSSCIVATVSNIYDFVESDRTWSFRFCNNSHETVLAVIDTDIADGVFPSESVWATIGPISYGHIGNYHSDNQIPWKKFIVDSAYLYVVNATPLLKEIGAIQSHQPLPQNVVDQITTEMIMDTITLYHEDLLLNKYTFCVEFYPE